MTLTSDHHNMICVEALDQIPSLLDDQPISTTTEGQLLSHLRDELLDTLAFYADTFRDLAHAIVDRFAFTCE